MSSDALSKLWKQAEPRGAERLVLAVLADHCDFAGTVSMSQRMIGQMAAMPKATVAEAINRLARAGHIAIIEAGGGYKHPSAYRLILDRDRATKDESATGQGQATKAHKEWYAGKVEGPASLPQKAEPLVETLADAMTAEAEPVAPDHSPAPAPVDWPYEIADGHPRNLVGAILTALQIQPDPEDFFWWRHEHKADAEDLARIAGGRDALIDLLQRVPAPKVPNGFRRLTALAGLVKEGRG